MPAPAPVPVRVPAAPAPDPPASGKRTDERAIAVRGAPTVEGLVGVDSGCTGPGLTFARGECCARLEPLSPVVAARIGLLVPPLSAAAAAAAITPTL